ncbi:nuclear factor of kappa light polypeptide gene enhancer in B-cells inhibitor, alpha b [Alosa sapidissima]|uniref:nuclear factor of kappa light polypeptide gene enhancer in B-cells inhibitor, alpha b n=1 Tax=Alosa sapidissima TaxID=34773 RepID=UPI001C09563A|nr:nuclear factor of kappa light polypeptide gene enhancer in B-cells inhibitor, alpha b [Alosa sapidissima]
MDVYQAYRHNQMDYNAESRDSKFGKGLQNIDDRLDSGVDSLREDVAAELERVRLDSEPAPRIAEDCCEPWRKEMTEDGDTFLHLAIIHEAKDHAMKMIDLSVNDPFLNIQNYQRQTALHLAVITEQPEVVAHLMRAGCDPQLVDDSGNTALHIACRKGSVTCFSVLTQACTSSQLSAMLTTLNYSGQNCLHQVSIFGYLSLVERLVELGADINAQEQCNGRTPLHLAVDLQNYDLVHLLISKGADVNSQTYGGHTPYHLTFGRPNGAIQVELYELTAQHLRALPDSESEDSGEEEQEQDDQYQSDDEFFDDIQLMG